MVLVDILSRIEHSKYTIISPTDDFDMETITPYDIQEIIVQEHTESNTIEELSRIFPNCIISTYRPVYLPYTQDESNHALKTYIFLYLDSNDILDVSHMKSDLNEFTTKEQWFSHNNMSRDMFELFIGNQIDKVRLSDNTVIQLSTNMII